MPPIDSVADAAAASPDLKRTRRARAASAPSIDRLPPHSIEAEQGVLGCILLEPGALKSLPYLRADLFYDLRHQTLFRALRQLRDKGIPIDTISVAQWLKDGALLEEIGGIPFLNKLQDSVPSAANLAYYLEIVREKAALRQMIAVCDDTVGRILECEGDVESLLMGVRADIETAARAGMTAEHRPALKVWRVKELCEYVPPPHLQLVGDNEIVMGFEGVCVVAGPGSSGKSLCVSSLALMGAIGCGFWMGRKVHRQFRTLIIQAENGKRRMKKEVEAFLKNHPEHAEAIQESIFFSEPPEGGLPFHHAEFRAAVRRAIEELKPDLVVIDPWSQVATEDAAKEVVDKLNEIRSCFPSGDTCPGLLIIAHTKKPRAEDVRKGRGLTYLVSGSIALPNTARCVYVLLPWTEDLTDARIYWTCCKLNDGEMYAPTVWQRRFGTAFAHDDKTDPQSWGREEGDERCKITEDHLRTVFEGKGVLRQADIVKGLRKVSGAAENTCYRAIADGEGGYLRKFMMRDAETGKLKLKEP